MAAAGTDYFQSALPPSPLQHYWSLAVEEQFYVVWPVLIVSIIWARKRWGVSFSLPMIVLSVAVAVTAGTFVFAMYQSQAAPTIAYFSTFTRAWELGVGAILAALSTRLAHMRLAIRQALGFGGLAGIVISAFAIGPESTFPAPLGALPVIATAKALVRAGLVALDFAVAEPVDKLQRT
ncbi:acyltransferase family protein [Rhodococcus oxybenzonivorans]|uniref:acyltransferase family protein n=1 Tax=Rhodococcus oxybenzonivorans TaxID=1990687 RepID=UPI0013A58EBE|nr:acyltransferase [Rhodococcus oxybenzonivorans]